MLVIWGSLRISESDMHMSQIIPFGRWFSFTGNLSWFVVERCVMAILLWRSGRRYGGNVTSSFFAYPKNGGDSNCPDGACVLWPEKRYIPC